LDEHPGVALLHNPSSSNREGGGKYFFHDVIRRNFVPKWAMSALERELPEDASFAGVKAPWLLCRWRGRVLLAEMSQVKLVVVVKDWLDWLKSAAVYSEATDATTNLRRCVWALARSANKTRAWSDVVPMQLKKRVTCFAPWDSVIVVPQVRDLLSRGVPQERLKVLHLDSLREDPRTLRRLSRWLLVPSRAGDATPELPRENSCASQSEELAFFDHLCALPRNLSRRFDAERRRATVGLARLLRDFGEPVPSVVRRALTTDVHEESCARVAAARRAI